MALAAGTRLVPYEVVSALGAGGMGEVYRARDTRLKRDVALKILPESFASDADRLVRFQREAEVLASLNHPNIAAIYGLEDSNGTRALVMELVDGETLADRIGRGPIPIDEALPIAKQIAEALEAAHEQGVIHRDLKPANIKVRPDGTVKVLDFGLAKLAESAVATPGKPASMSMSPTITSPALVSGVGVLLGTAAYMSPEQAKGKPADKRSDIWAFGCVLYEMLTAKRAFVGEDVADTFASILARQPDWSTLPTTTPAGLRAALRRCLDKARDQRYRDIADVRIQVEDAFTDSGDSSTTLPSGPGRGFAPWVATATTIVLVFALAIPAIRHFRETAPETTTIQSTILAPQNTTLDFTNGLGLPAISPDGRRLVVGAESADGKHALWVRPLDGLSAQPLVGTAGASFPFWSPDGRFIAFFADGKLKKIAVGGGPVITLADAPNGRGGSWSREGVILFAPGTIANGGGGDFLVRISDAGGTSKRVRDVGSFPWFLPDGDHFLYQENGSAATNSFQTFISDLPIHVSSLSGGDDVTLGTGSNAMYAAGHLLFLREGTLMGQPFSVERLATTGDPIPLAENVQTVLNSGRVGVFSISDRGLLLFRQGAGRRRQLVWVDRTGKTIGRIGTDDDSLDGFPELAPDDRRLTLDRIVRGNGDIWIVDLQRGATMTRFTFGDGLDRRPVWNPDGRQIAFASSRRANDFDLYVKQSGGTGSEQLLIDTPNLKTPYGWSPDGRFLLYREDDPKTARDIWVLPMDGDRTPRPIAHSRFNELNGQFSPDGRWIAYQSNESGRFEIYVVPFPVGDGKWQISSDSGLWPRWRHDGKELFFVTRDGEMMAATVSASGSSFEASTPVPLFNRVALVVDAADGKHQYAVAADGRFLLTVPSEEATQSLTLLQNWSAQTSQRADR
jgi:serine/threonine protein kinase/Tol biopolymer transport system component